MTKFTNWRSCPLNPTFRRLKENLDSAKASFADVTLPRETEITRCRLDFAAAQFDAYVTGKGKPLWASLSEAAEEVEQRHVETGGRLPFEDAVASLRQHADLLSGASPDESAARVARVFESLVLAAHAAGIPLGTAVSALLAEDAMMAPAQADPDDAPAASPTAANRRDPWAGWTE